MQAWSFRLATALRSAFSASQSTNNALLINITESHQWVFLIDEISNPLCSLVTVRNGLSLVKSKVFVIFICGLAEIF